MSLSVTIVGLNGIAKAHIKAIAQIPDLQLTGVCDIQEEIRNARAQELNVPAFADMESMMQEAKPDVLVIATPTASHALLTKSAAALKPSVIICEKPMAVTYADAVSMVETCKENDVTLLINHQRRLGLVKSAIDIVAEGTLGELMELDGFCGGDFLTDGTHLIDSLMAIAGDPELEYITAGIDIPQKSKERYGHAAENGLSATWYSTNNVRFCANTGYLARRNAYQEYRIMGSKGELWFPGGGSVNWYLRDGKPGNFKKAFDKSGWYLIPELVESGGDWHQLPAAAIDDWQLLYQGVVDLITNNEQEHPLSGQRTLQVQSLLNAAYLAAKTQRQISLPLPAGDSSIPLQ